SRPRVWSEAFHSSGWGRTTDQTLSWLSANYAFGANLYDEHGLYYSIRASTWEHAAPDPHWRQPYWRYYDVLSDWVARMSYLMGQGTHVADVAVHYPVVSFLAGEAPGRKGPDYNLYMRLSRAIYDAAIDNDIIDDDSILAAPVEDGKLIATANTYQALVFGPETTIRRSVLEQAARLAESGGSVVFFGRLPSASTEAGRNDPRLVELIERILGELPAGTTPSGAVTRRFPSGGFAAFVPTETQALVRLISDHVDRDFTPLDGSRVFVAHRRIGDVNVYLVQNPSEGALDLEARCRVDGVAELWDPFSGEVRPVERFERMAPKRPSQLDPNKRTGGGTYVRQRLDGNTAYLLVVRPGQERSRAVPTRRLQPDGTERPLAADWMFSVMATRDNRWGEFRWPPSEQPVGLEVRSFRYGEEPSQPGTELGWHLPDYDDGAWAGARYSIGPYWLHLHPVPEEADVAASVLGNLDQLGPGTRIDLAGKSLTWRTVEFSKTIGLARPAPWGGHSGYPDGAIDQNFIELGEGRKLLFTRIRSPKDQRLGLRIELRNSKPRLWVDGVEQPVEGAVGNLPLQAGVNTVLLDLPDGGRGMLYVEAQPPSVASLADAARAEAGPDLGETSWIRIGDSGSGYVREVFHLEEVPEDAKIVMTAYTGYRLFVNGVKVEEEIGPWAKWTHPESIHVTPYLRRGKNVLAAWIQVHSGQHFHGVPGDLALALALKARLPGGEVFTLVSDGSWKGSIGEQAGWEEPGFDDGGWQPVKVLGRMGVPPWGTEPVANVGLVTEPRRKLAIDLPSPYLTCFDEVPEIIYDVKPPAAKRIGWYRFEAPPGLRGLRLRTDASVRVWVDGAPVTVSDGSAKVPEPPSGVSRVALRLEMEPGAYGGAAFPLPIGLEVGGGTIQPGKWADFAMPTYSGIGVYEQPVTLTAEEARRRTELDLGEVLVAAEVLVNGKPAGVRLARPFKFDLAGVVREGENTIEVRVANTIAPHYTVTNRVHNLGPTASGLIGPVILRQELPAEQWSAWAREEVSRLRRKLATSTAELEAAQREWEKMPRWTVLDPVELTSAGKSTLRKLPDGSVLALGVRPETDVYTLRFDTELTGIAGFRLEVLPHESLPQGGPGRAPSGNFLLNEFRIAAALPRQARFRGRVVRVQMVDRNEYLHLAEVQVFSNGENVALRGEARQSSTFSEGPARLATDDNTDGNWAGRSVCHTLKQDDPWWEVDLGSVAPIDRIVIWNRTDGNLQTRLSRFRVSLADEAGRTVWQRLLTEPPDPQVELYLSPMPVALRNPSASFSQAGFSFAGTIDADGSDQSAWGVTPQVGQRQTAVFETARSVGFQGGTTLTVNLTQSAGAGNTIGRFRISATTMKPPLYDVPPPVAKILAAGPGQRRRDDQATLAAFYRSIAPQLQPIRDRLARLETELEESETEREQ
ncbi:MAG: glycosylhydrolase-like jelly roll fold domain-containing protein, partial [Planctomycetota bacterium]